jgi:hypothetical protein
MFLYFLTSQHIQAYRLMKYIIFLSKFPPESFWWFQWDCFVLSSIFEKFITATKEEAEITVHKFIGHRMLFPFQDKNVACSCECLSSKFILRDDCVFRYSHRPYFHITIFNSRQRVNTSYCMIRYESPPSSPSLPIHMTEVFAKTRRTLIKLHMHQSVLHRKPSFCCRGLTWFIYSKVLIQK